MDENKGRFEEIFPVVTTVYKSTSPMDFVAVLKFKVYNSSFYSPTTEKFKTKVSELK